MSSYKTLGADMLRRIQVQLAALAARPDLGARAPGSASDLERALGAWRDASLAQDQARETLRKALRRATEGEQAAIAALRNLFARNLDFVASVVGKQHPDYALFGGKVRRKGRSKRVEATPEAAPPATGHAS